MLRSFVLHHLNNLCVVRPQGVLPPTLTAVEMQVIGAEALSSGAGTTVPSDSPFAAVSLSSHAKSYERSQRAHVSLRSALNDAMRCTIRSILSRAEACLLVQSVAPPTARFFVGCADEMAHSGIEVSRLYTNVKLKH